MNVCSVFVSVCIILHTSQMFPGYFLLIDGNFGKYIIFRFFKKKNETKIYVSVFVALATFCFVLSLSIK